eukprot:g4020.t1
MKAVKNSFAKTNVQEKNEKKKLAKLMKELHRSLKGDMLHRAVKTAVDIAERPPNDMKDAQRKWTNVLQAIPDKSKKKKVHNCFKLLYLSAVQKKDIEFVSWNENPMRVRKKRQSMWRICTDEATGKIFYVNDTTKERRRSIPIEQTVTV